MQPQLVGHLGSRHCVWQILLVRVHEQNTFTELVLIKHAMKFVTCSIDTIAVIRVNHEDQALRVLVIMAPERADLILSPYIPYSERNILVFNLKKSHKNQRVR